MKYDKIFIDLINERKDWEGCFSPNKRDLSICYYLTRTGAAKIDDLNDLLTLYDNLVVNSEIIEADTIENYDNDTIKELTGLKAETAKAKTKAGVFWLFDYYDKNGHHHTKLKLNNNYNDIEQHASQELREIIRGL